MNGIKLKRYNQNYYESRYYESSDGKWVKWEDVKPLLSNMVDKLGTILDNLDNNKEHLSEIVKKALKN